ncbi:cytokinin riboside 5'-monophosphate phosphoribohydrolase LOGL5 [Spatholobus suberectus]|nr:cytokinin riboside 5'-monophosphate phosphoribohydrolase LOGL5 [Spatholobus suberectus]
MGFSVAASLGAHVVLRDTHETRIKCQFLCRKEQNNGIGFKFSKQRASQRAIFVSKQEFSELDERKSPDEVREEIKKCYELINRLGRGVVYLGSSRMGPGHSHYVQAQGLAKEANEVFEILALIQLERIGSQLPVPFLLMNYDSFYSKLLDFLNDCEGWGTVSKGEVASFWKVCNSNSEALAYLEDFYCISSSDKKHDNEVTDLHRMSPQSTVRKLCLRGMFKKLPNWIPGLQNLVKLSLIYSMLTHDPLESLKDLKNFCSPLEFRGKSRK